MKYKKIFYDIPVTSIPGIILIAILSLFIWRFALFSHRTAFHGDTIIFGLPLFDLRTKVLFGQASMLWADGVYGGHPLFAEGQAAFMSIVPMFLAAFVTPIAGTIYTMNLFLFLCMIFAGIGTIGLCRSLGLGRWSTAFAALAVVFSPIWLDMQRNPGVNGSFLWVPWCLWSMEVWLKRPSFRSAAIMATAVASSILAGYPQAFHGTVVYMAMTMLAIPFAPQMRRDWAATWRIRLATGAIAGIICAGLAAVQLLPLAELVGLSHRNSGIGLQFQAPAGLYVRGLLYSLPWNAGAGESIPSVGSLLVCVAASLVILFNASPRLIGHLVATAVLLQLGIGWESPFFRMIYRHDLLPGLHYLRTVNLYLTIAAVGFAVVAGGAIDGITRRLSDREGPLSEDPTIRGLAAMAFLWGLILLLLRTPDAPALQLYLLLAATVGAAFLVQLGRGHLFASLMTALLLFECVSLRIQPFRLTNDTQLAEPESVKAIEALPDWREFKIADRSLAGLYNFLDSRSPGMVSRLHRMLSAASGLTPILWNLNGMDGALALPLARRTEIQPLLEDEINGKAAASPGLRLIDVLSIRFASLDGPVSTPGFRLFWHQGEDAWVMENVAALPRFQTYTRHVSVESPEAALKFMKDWKERVLVIENPRGVGHQDELPDSPDGSTGKDPPPIAFEVEDARATSYRLNVSAPQQGWLFLADANYPGWTATLDDVKVPLFTAQILGKAVAIPAGRHEVRIEFHSASFQWGAGISLTTLFLTTFAMTFGTKAHGQSRRLIGDVSASAKA